MEWTAITSAISKNVDGIILCPVQKTEGNVRYLMETGIPFTLIGRRFDQIPTNYVVCDDENRGYLCRILFALGKSPPDFVFKRRRIYLQRKRETFGNSEGIRRKGNPSIICGW
ncbi:MAG: hypothetical protein ACLR23_15655 [Clostridia bacterium]